MVGITTNTRSLYVESTKFLNVRRDDMCSYHFAIKNEEKENFSRCGTTSALRHNIFCNVPSYVSY